jgi:hypothetical protein
VIDDVLDELMAALKAVPGVRAYEDPGASVDPPATVLGPPTFTWDGYRPEPTSATFNLALVSQADDRALRRLLVHLPDVRAAVESLPSAVVRTATPGTLAAGGSELPAYLIQIEVAL